MIHNWKRSMAESTMPDGGARPCSTQDTSTQLGKRIKAISTSAFQKSFPCDLILNQEKIWVKFKESLIIFCKAMNKDKAFLSLRDMKDIIKMQRMRQLCGASGSDRNDGAITDNNG